VIDTKEESLPIVESIAKVSLSKNPSVRTSLGAACTLTIAWYHPVLYPSVLSYYGTFVNQQWPNDLTTPKDSQKV
jgi:hypothetical protein